MSGFVIGLCILMVGFIFHLCLFPGNWPRNSPLRARLETLNFFVTIPAGSLLIAISGVVALIR